jgi:hypothetical protein
VSFSVFRKQYYQERLACYESLDLARLSETELIDVAGEASSLHKFLTDILEEGYADAVNQLVAQTDAMHRLQQVLSTVLHVLGPPSERERFYLFPKPTALDGITTASFAGGKTLELSAYLDELDHLSERVVDIAPCFDTDQHRQRWQAKTQVLMTEMFAFLKWICGELRRREPVVPVPLLRDTLLIDMGLKWLRRQGLSAQASKPAMIGRKFADTCGNNGRYIHATLGDVIYRVLLESHPCDVAGLRRQFTTYVVEEPDIPVSFTQACRDYLRALDLEAPPLFIESGVQGTFPLFLLSLTGDVGDMVFYTTTPWLYPTYEPVVFQKNYNYLREMETIIAHDHLFQFKAWHEGRVYVEETTNERARRLALYEIRVFKEMVKRRMDEIV